MGAKPSGSWPNCLGWAIRALAGGAHARDDFQSRDDENWMKHTVMWLDENNKSRLDYRGVVMNTLSNDVAPIPPAPRVY